jgi:Tfp pilus assembly protein PilV
MYKHEKGWVLIDSLIGLVFVTIALIAIVSAMQQSTVVTTASNNYNQAVNVAQQELEILKSTHDGAVNTTLPSDKINQIYNIHYSWVTTSLANVVGINVQIIWTERGLSKSINMTSYYYN